jgi:hypothetical protein
MLFIGRAGFYSQRTLPQGGEKLPLPLALCFRVTGALVPKSPLQKQSDPASDDRIRQQTPFHQIDHYTHLFVSRCCALPSYLFRVAPMLANARIVDSLGR